MIRFTEICWNIKQFLWVVVHLEMYMHLCICKIEHWLGVLCAHRFHTRLHNVYRYILILYTFKGGTPLNNPPIEIHANSSMFALRFWPHVTIFCIFWLHECLKWRLEFNSKSLFWCQSRQTFEVRAIEQRHHEFQLIHMPPHQFWARYHSDGLSPVRVHFEFFSKQICNVEALICHFYKNIKTLTQIHFPRDAIYFVHALFFTGTIRGCTKCGRI